MLSKYLLLAQQGFSWVINFILAEGREGGLAFYYDIELSVFVDRKQRSFAAIPEVKLVRH